MKDAGLKELLLKHYWRQGYIAQPEVDAYYSSGELGDSKMVTDVDVLALRPHPDLYFEKVLGDCKTLKNQSPISRALWLSGAMKFLNAQSGVILLGLKKIEADHKLAAAELNVVLLNEADFQIYDKAINYRELPATSDISQSDLNQLRNLPSSFPKLKNTIQYFYRDAWLEQHFGELIRKSLGNLRLAAKELDPSKKTHLAFVADAAAIMSIGIAQCCGKVFRRYLHPKDKESLAESLRILIWGGKDKYYFMQGIRKRILESKGQGSDDSPLELPEWNTFVQLIRQSLDYPSETFRMPWILRHLAIDLLRDRPPLTHFRSEDLIAVKFSMLSLEYTCKAAGLPKDFQNELASHLVRVQSDLASVSIKQEAKNELSENQKGIKSNPNRLVGYSDTRSKNVHVAKTLDSQQSLFSSDKSPKAK